MNDAVDHLQLRLTISNIGAATYDLTKYLAQQGKPFSDSQYTIKNGKLFTKKLKYMKIPPEYRIVSFDIISLFANAPLDDLDETIEIISKRIYDNEEINTDILNKEMRKLLHRCTKNAHFTLNNKIYIQLDGAAMVPPGPVSTNIFMVELQRSIIPLLYDDISLWERYQDDTICFINRIWDFEQLHKNIKFTIEIETENKISFLDVLLIRNNSLITTKVNS